MTDIKNPAHQVNVGDATDWAGWDRSNYPWSVAKHQDAVCAALFGPTWSMDQAHSAISAIDDALSNWEACNGQIHDLPSASPQPIMGAGDFGIEDSRLAYQRDHAPQASPQPKPLPPSPAQLSDKDGGRE